MTLSCPHCGKSLALALTAVAVVPAAPPEPPARPLVAAGRARAPKPERLCGCGHEAAKHDDGVGQCRHGHGTPTGGCQCPGVHSRRPRTAPGELSPAALRIAHLVALFHPAAVDVVQVAITLVYSHGSGSFAKALTRLREADLVYGSSQQLCITASGLARFGAAIGFDASGVLERWCDRLGEQASSMLLRFVQASPAVVPAEVLARETGYRATSGSFAKALRKLRRLGLVDGWSASEALMRAMVSIPAAGAPREWQGERTTREGTHA